MYFFWMIKISIHNYELWFTDWCRMMNVCGKFYSGIVLFWTEFLYFILFCSVISPLLGRLMLAISSCCELCPTQWIIQVDYIASKSVSSFYLCNIFYTQMHGDIVCTSVGVYVFSSMWKMCRNLHEFDCGIIRNSDSHWKCTSCWVFYHF